MTRIRFHSLLCAVMFLFAGALSGCVPSVAGDRQFYIVDAIREGKPAAAHKGATLRLQRFGVDKAFATKQLVYRLGEFRYESDYYHQYLVTPGIMITTETRDWLEDSGLFERVSAADGGLASAYTLEGNIKALYADFTNESAPVAVMKIRFFFLEGADADGAVVFAETYGATSPIAAKTAEAVVEGLSRSLEAVLARLETDLAEVLARTSGAAGNP